MIFEPAAEFAQYKVTPAAGVMSLARVSYSLLVEKRLTKILKRDCFRTGVAFLHFRHRAVLPPSSCRRMKRRDKGSRW